MTFKNKLNQSQIGAITLCFSAALGSSIWVWSSSPVIGVMLGTITVGVYIMMISGKWGSKNT